jgi:hypothetical protein
MAAADTTYEGPIVDSSVHNDVVRAADLYDYLPAHWRNSANADAVDETLDVLLGDEYRRPGGSDRDDALTDDRGGPPGSDPELLVRQVGSPRLEAVILNHNRLLAVAKIPNLDLADALGAAANQWLAERWLPLDERFYGSIVVANQVPVRAAQEIRRMADNPRMVQISMSANGIGHAWGHPLFDPIYEAAAELELPVSIHAGAHGGINPSPTAGGRVSYYVEHEVLSLQGMMTGLASLIAGGVFERFPSLRVILQGGGVGWIPGFLWRYDTDYRGVRREIPWARRRPLEYFATNVRVSTESLDYAASGSRLVNALADVGGENTLVYASDYPRRRSATAASDIASRLPAEWLERVFFTNALGTFPRIRQVLRPE